jgi:rifampicin phosphotransferase
VTSLLLDGVTAADDGSRTRIEAEQVARQALGADDLPEFDHLLAVARRAYPNREENIVHCDNIPCGLLRRWLVEVSQRLVARGLLSRVDDGPWLLADELVAGLRGATSGEDLRAAANRRRSEYAWTRAHPGPIHVGEPDAMPDVSKLPDAARRLNGALMWMVSQEYPPDREVDAADALAVGAAGSPGTYTGPAKVVLSERDFGKVRPGDVMVCPVTTPAWTLLFATAGALVTDAGGVLSHAAIVAREHGIPAVLGTGDLTTRVHDGDVITVNGTAGTVQRAHQTT